MTKAQHRSLLDTIIKTQDDANKALRKLLADLHNRKPHRGRRTAPPTRAVKQKILDYKRANPRLSNQEIAIALKVSSGRVSEVLHGKRR